MRNFILTKWWFLLFAVVVVTLSAAQLVMKENLTKVGQVMCSAVSMSKYGDTGIKANLQCGDRKAWTVGADETTYFFNHRDASLSCTLFMDGEAECTVPKQEK